MRIAMLAPLYESVPPKGYGGTERIVYYLVEELHRRGHQVTLFATGTSSVSCALVPVCDEAMPVHPDPDDGDPCAAHVLQLGMAFSRASEFDVIHSHCELRALPFAQATGACCISTDHNRLDRKDVRMLSRHYPEAPLISISNSQRALLPDANWVGTAYNGIPVDEFPFRPDSGEYLAFVGRLSPDKGPDDAIKVACALDIPLKIAAKINDWERDYYESVLKPLVCPPYVEFLGEVNEQEKRDLLAGALALLFPIKWPEPFGLVMTEAMATGTPVLTYRSGATPEVVRDGVNGFLCRDLDEMTARCRDVASIDRAACRAYTAEHFSDRAMADSYEAAYRRVIARHGSPALSSIA